MNENIKNSTMYDTMPAVSGLNKVSGFDPRKFMRKIISELTKQEVMYLDLKYKKLWFRIAHPKGKIKKTALRINEQIAIIEAKVFLNKDDTEPVSTFIAQRNAGEKPGYIEAAQYAAENQALIDAGFGLQFCDVSQGNDTEMLDEGIPVITTAIENTPVVSEKDPVVIQNISPVEQIEAPLVNEKADEPKAQLPHAENIAVAESKDITEEQPQDDITQYLSYTADMPMEKILEVMTLEEARHYYC